MKFRKGDKVSAVGVVDYVFEDENLGATVKFSGGGSETIRLKDLTLVERKFEVGEKIFDLDDPRSDVWTIVGADGSSLWMKRKDGQYRTAPAVRCWLVDDANPDADDAPLPPPDPPRSGLDDEGGSTSPKTYTVKAGDTLGVLALVHGTSIEELRRLNEFPESYQLVAGQVLELPR